MANYPKIGLIAFLNTAAFSHGLRTYTAGLATMTGQTLAAERTLSGGFAAMGDGVLRMARNTAIAVGIIGLAAVGVAAKFTVNAAKAYVDSETAFADVVKTAGNLTTEFGVLNREGIALKDTLLEMSMVKPLKFAELSEIAAVAAQTGLATELLPAYVDMIADLTAATRMTGEDAANRIAKFMNIMGLFDDDAETSVENINSLGAAIADLGNTFPVFEDELIVITGRLAGMGKAAGFLPQDLLALGAAMLAVDVRSEAGGTAGQRVMMEMLAAISGAQTGATFIDRSGDIAKSTQRIAKYEQDLAIKRQQIAEQTDRTAQSTRMRREADLANLEAGLESERVALESFQNQHGKSAKRAASDLDKFAKVAGVSAIEFARIFRERPGLAMELFILGLGEAGDQAGAILKDLGLGDARLVRTYTQLAGAGDLITQTMETANRAWDEQVALTDEAAERYATLEAIFKMLANMIDVVNIRVGKTLEPAMKQIVKMFQSIEAPGKKLISLFERRLGPAIEDVAVAMRLLTMGDKSGAGTALKSALIKGFGADTTIIVWRFVDGVTSALDTISTWIRDNRPLIDGVIKGVGILLATSGIVMWLVRIGEKLLWLTSPIGLLTLGMAGLGVAWETNWLGMRDRVIEFVEATIPKLENWWAQTSKWFNEELKPKIVEGDWIGAGLVIMQSIEQGIQNAIAAMIPLEERLRTWVGGQLGAEVDVDADSPTWRAIGYAMWTGIQGGIEAAISEAPSWVAMGYDLWTQANTGIARAIKEGPSVVDLLANAIGGGLGLEPILTDDDIRRGIEKNISWVRIGHEMGRRMWGGLLAVEGGVAQLFQDFAAEDGAGYSAAEQIGRGLGSAILYGISVTIGSKEFWQTLGYGLSLAITKVIPGLAIMVWEMSQALSATLLAGLRRTSYEEERARIDRAKEYWKELARDTFPDAGPAPWTEGETLASWWARNFFAEDSNLREGGRDAAREERAARSAIEALEDYSPEMQDVLRELRERDFPETKGMNPAELALWEARRQHLQKNTDALEQLSPEAQEIIKALRETEFPETKGMSPAQLALWEMGREGQPIGPSYEDILDIQEQRIMADERALEQAGLAAQILTDRNVLGQEENELVRTHMGIVETERENMSRAAASVIEAADLTAAALVSSTYTMTAYEAALNNSKEVARIFIEESLGFWHAAILAMRISAQTLARSLASPAGLGLPSNVPELARGTNFFAGGLALVGEKGPEVVSLPRGSKVFSNDSLMNRFSMPANISNNSTYNINVELPIGSPFETQQAASIGVMEALRAVGVA